MLSQAGARWFGFGSICRDWEQLARCVAKEIDGERNWETGLKSEEEGSKLESKVTVSRTRLASIHWSSLLI